MIPCTTSDGFVLQTADPTITRWVPHELTDYIRGCGGYAYAHHGKSRNPSTDFVPDQVVDRFCLVGPPSAHVDRLTELAELAWTGSPCT